MFRESLPCVSFDPEYFASISCESPPSVTQKWCNWEGKPTSFVGPVPSPQQVAALRVQASPSMLTFRDPSFFVHGQLHNNLPQWEFIAEHFPPQREPLCFIGDKVNVASFIVPFKGKFAGKFFNSPFPPEMEFPNSPICAQFEEFISSTIIDRVKNGSLVFWGRVGQVEAPHLVMPITVEPSKPRMCHDERFLKACYFVCDTLPFGWKASAYVYHTIGLLATSYIRTLSVPCSHYIDDRHAGQLMVRRDPNLDVWSDFELAEAAAYIVISVLTSLGYTLALSKSSLVPSQRVRSLGYLCDSLLLAFVLPETKSSSLRP